MKKKYMSPTENTAKNNGGIEAEPQFATRRRANDFLRLMRTLPDPDPILRKMGRGITALQELLSDSHLESVWSVRCSTISGAEWFMQAGGEDRRAKEAAEAFGAMLGEIDVPRVIEEMMEAVAFGYAPLEILWKPDNGRWGIADIVGKPPQWFEFDQDNRLVFKAGIVTEELPENRFLIARHRPSYANPYGIKVFSKCYWPITFKKNGFRWWTVFVEKYGGAFLSGKYPSNAGEQYKNELLAALEAMIADAVAIFPEGAEITIESLANKGSVNSVHKEYIEAANAEISKAVLGQTLTTEIGGNGSYAAAQAHNMVREDLAAADRRRVGAAFTLLAAVWTRYNFGAEVEPPKFEFVRDEDLQKERAERDTKLYAIGWRPKKSYITREYEIPEEDFDITETNVKENETFKTEGGAVCSCGKKVKQNIFKKLFMSKKDKRRAQDIKRMSEFAVIMAGAGQEALDEQIEKYVDALGTVDNFADALAALRSANSKTNHEKFARVIDEVRFAAQVLGGDHA